MTRDRVEAFEHLEFKLEGFIWYQKDIEGPKEDKSRAAEEGEYSEDFVHGGQRISNLTDLAPH